MRADDGTHPRRTSGRPWLEHSPEARQALGARYATVCAIASPHDDTYEHGYLLWSDEPFTERAVTRQMTALGFTVTAVGATGHRWHPWQVAVSAGPDTRLPTHVVAFRGDYTTAGWLGIWSRTAGRVLYDSPEEGWKTAGTLHTLYADKGLWEDPHDWVALVTAEQAERVARQLGRRLPGVAGLDAAVRADRAVVERRWALWAEFTARRLERFAVEVRQVIEEGDRLAAVDPPRRAVAYVAGRHREAERIAAVPVRAGESFPLVRFLIGSFRDRRRGGVGDYDVHCNRLALTAPGGERLDLVLELQLSHYSQAHDEAFTPYCPDEAAWRDDPAIPAQLAAERPPIAIPALVFPVSPTAIRITARPLPATRDPGRWRDLRLTLTFPDGGEWTTPPGWDDDCFRWRRFRSAREGEIFVPDDVDVMKGVRARFAL